MIIKTFVHGVIKKKHENISKKIVMGKGEGKGCFSKEPATKQCPCWPHFFDEGSQRNSCCSIKVIRKSATFKLYLAQRPVQLGWAIVLNLEDHLLDYKMAHVICIKLIKQPWFSIITSSNLNSVLHNITPQCQQAIVEPGGLSYGAQTFLAPACQCSKSMRDSGSPTQTPQWKTHLTTAASIFKLPNGGPVTPQSSIIIR